MFRLFALIFVLVFLFTCPGWSEEQRPLEICSEMIAHNIDSLIKCLGYLGVQITEDDTQKLMLLPDEINRNEQFFSMEVTDGENLWNIFLLVPKDFNFSVKQFDTPDFKKKLLQNSYFADAFPDKNPQFIKRFNALYIISSTFPVERLNELSPEIRWKFLYEQYGVAFLTKYPERKLLPVLPPESENESAFVKKIREQRKKVDKKEEEENEFSIVGLEWDKNMCYLESITEAAEETEKAKRLIEWKEKQTPFQAGGFVDPKAAVYGSVRWYPFDPLYSKSKLMIKFGIMLPPTEREIPTQHYAVLLSAMLKPDEDNLNQCYVVNLENVILAVPLNPENVPPEKNILSAKELDELNKKCLDSLGDFAKHLQEVAKTFDQDKPLDIAFSVEDNILYLAVALPPGGESVDWRMAEKIQSSLNGLFEKTPSLSEEDEQVEKREFRYKFLGTETKDEILFLKNTIAIEGLYDILPFVVAKKENLYGITLDIKRLMNNDEEIDSEEFAQRQIPILKEKLEMSARLEAAKLFVPKTLLRMNSNDGHLDVTYETRNRQTIWSMKFDQNSIAFAIILAKMFSGKQ